MSKATSAPSEEGMMVSPRLGPVLAPIRNDLLNDPMWSKYTF